MTFVADDDVVADPTGVIVAVVAEVEQGLDVERIREVVAAVAGGRAARRRLAQSLKDDPRVLRTGRPPAVSSAGSIPALIRG